MGRPRAFQMRAASGKTFVRVYNPTTAEGFKSAIAEAAKPHIPFLPLEGPLELSLTFFMPRPKAHFRKNGELKPNAPEWHVSKPDRDNLDKTVMDTLKRIGMFKDDSQVCSGRIIKQYAGLGYQPGCVVCLRECGDAEVKA